MARVTVFEQELDLSDCEVLDSRETSATHLPQLAECLETIVYQFGCVVNDKHAFDILLITSEFTSIAQQFGAFIKHHNFHVSATRTKAAEGAETFLFRVYNSADNWPCIEHPELLSGQPIGQYHCPACGEMVMAGMLHPDYRDDLMFDGKKPEEGMNTLLDPIHNG